LLEARELEAYVERGHELSAKAHAARSFLEEARGDGAYASDSDLFAVNLAHDDLQWPAARLAPQIDDRQHTSADQRHAE
jgi:hypothetical protein